MNGCDYVILGLTALIIAVLWGQARKEFRELRVEDDRRAREEHDRTWLL